jgi:hypothetical protein
VFIVGVPLIGMTAYLMWRISRSDALADSIEYEDELSRGNKKLPPRL